MESALCSDCHEQRGDTGVESDVYECLFGFLCKTLVAVRLGLLAPMK